MRILFVLFAVLVASTSAGRGGHSKEQRNAVIKDCLHETGATIEEFKKSFHEENPSHAVKCTIHCFSRKMGMLTDDENIDLAKVQEKFGKDDKKAAALKQCEETAKGESDKCARTFIFKRCLMKAVRFGKGKGGKRGPPPEDDDDDNV